jgi:hypothetical protein
MERIYSRHPPTGEPPENELPTIVAAPEATWHGEGIVFAIPSLHVYTTGVELQMIFRTSYAHPRTVEQAQQNRQALRRLTVNGRHVTLLRGEQIDHGFNYQAWIPSDGPAVGDMTLTLDWPGLDKRPRLVSGIAEAVQRVTVLW